MYAFTLSFHAVLPNLLAFSEYYAIKKRALMITDMHRYFTE